MALSLLTGLAGAASQAQGTPQDQEGESKPAAPIAARKPGYLTVKQLADEINTSIRWLRSQQDPKTGAYGNVQVTCLVLTAFAECPAHYGYDDGPFVSKALDYLVHLQRPDGAICDPGSNELMERVCTNACQDALPFFHDAPGVANAIAGCNQFTHRPATNASWDATLANTPDDQLLTRAEDLLWTRHPEGYWENALGRLRVTALNTEKLSGYYGVLKKREEAPAAASAAVALPPPAEAGKAKAEEALARGARFLLGAAEDGRFGFPGRPDPGITAMVAAALLTTPPPREPAVDAALEKALDWLASLQHEDGSIHAGQLANYVTSASILAFARAGRAKDAPVLAKARAFLQALQADEGEGYAPSDRYYGGIGYGSTERPDLSNLQMALDALNTAGVKSDDPTMQKALAFLQRCQNRSESNDVVIEADGKKTKSGDDGGAAYAPGDSKAGFIDLPDGSRVPRSYGSMTYALLKGYLFAGLPKDDPRVQAAWSWLRANYTLEINPGFETSADPRAAYQGLFYYYYTMARALDLFGEETVVDASGTSHDWRSEMIARIVALQRQDGSWVNENAERWYEGNPVLATSYAMLALDRALARDAAAPAPGAGTAGEGGD